LVDGSEVATNLRSKYLFETVADDENAFSPLSELIVCITDVLVPVMRKSLEKSPMKAFNSFGSTEFAAPASKRSSGEEIQARSVASEFRLTGVMKADFARGSTFTELVTCIEMF
jgi:hypothetical protein